MSVLVWRSFATLRMTRERFLSISRSAPTTSSVPATVSRSISGVEFHSACSAWLIAKGVCRCPKSDLFSSADETWRLRHQLALDSFECIVCRGWGNPPRLTPRTQTLSWQAARGRGGRLRFVAARSAVRYAPIGKWRHAARAGFGTASDGGRDGSPARDL